MPKVPIKKEPNGQAKEIFLKYLPYAIIAIALLWADLYIWHSSSNAWSFGINYNSYVLQDLAWLSGHLYLPQNYSWLEIATYNNHFYISFPPIPSIILLPFVAIFRDNWPGLSNFLTLVVAVIGSIYAYKIGIRVGISKTLSTLLTLILTIGSGFLFIMNGSVWFIAQIFAFSFLLISIYLAITPNIKHIKWSLLFYALMVGCRPLCAIWIILIFFLVCKYKEFDWKKWTDWKKNLYQLIPIVIVGIFLATLNYVRFGNPIEFGHNYLPEFDPSSPSYTGVQFSFGYLKSNLISLFKLPTFYNGRWHWDTFNGIFFILPNIIYISFIVSIIGAPIHNWWQNSHSKDGTKHKIDSKFIILVIVVVAILHIIFTCVHKTMGGWHWGNRYIIDTTPAVFLATCYLMKDKKWLAYVMIPILIAGLIFNMWGSIGTYNYTM